MKKLSFVVVLLASLAAQGQSDTVKYQMLNDDPNYSYWGAGLTYDLSIDQFNFPLVGFGLDGIFMHEKFSANFHSTYNLFERLTDFSFNGQPQHESIYEPEKSREIGFIGSYYFKNDVETLDQNVRLKSSGNTVYVMEVPAKMSTRFGADLGFFTGVNYYNFGDATLTGVDLAGNTATLDSQDEDRAVSTMFNQSYLRVGVNRTKASNFEVITDQYGKKHTRDFTRIYAHFMYGFGQKLDDIFYLTPDILGNEIYTQYELTTNATFSAIGGAIGYEYYTMNKLGISYIAELGIYPGPKYSLGNNAYLDIKIRFHYGQFL